MIEDPPLPTTVSEVILLKEFGINQSTFDTQMTTFLNLRKQHAGLCVNTEERSEQEKLKLQKRHDCEALELETKSKCELHDILATYESEKTKCCDRVVDILNAVKRTLEAFKEATLNLDKLKKIQKSLSQRSTDSLDTFMNSEINAANNLIKQEHEALRKYHMLLIPFFGMATDCEQMLDSVENTMDELMKIGTVDCSDGSVIPMNQSSNDDDGGLDTFFPAVYKTGAPPPYEVRRIYEPKWV